MNPITALAIVLLFFSQTLHASDEGECAFSLPPFAPAGDHVDVYHGVEIRDPYRWLEDLDSPETASWVSSQREFTDQAFALMPERDAIRSRLTELWSYPRVGIPHRQGDNYFFRKNNGLQNHAVLYVQDRNTLETRVLFDPNELSSDGSVALTNWSVSPDGQWLGFGTSSAGSDWTEFHVRHIESGQETEDEIKWVKFSSLSWTQDSRGFFYGRYPEVLTGDKLFGKLERYCLYYHRLGTSQSQDIPVFAIPEHPEWLFNGVVTDDGRYLVISVRCNESTGNALYYLDLQDPMNPVFSTHVSCLLGDFDATYSLIGNHDDVFYLVTNHNAPFSKVVAIDLKDFTQKMLIPESQDSISMVHHIGSCFVVTYMHDVQSRLALFATDGSELGEIALPDIGTVSAVSGWPGEPEMFFMFSSFLHAPQIIRCDLETGASDLFYETKIDFDLSQYETHQHFFTSLDGTRVPMFVTHLKDLRLDGSAPLWLYGYGGFQSSLQPHFSVPPLVWLEKGGVYVQVNLRGGGEYGEEWYLAGTKERKQNVFDDFIAAADWLVSEGYTSHDRLVIHGRSNGGLLVASVLNQRPDLARVALPIVGVMDMLRFHKFTIGANWIGDYGSSEDFAGFTSLLAYSPIHNVKDEAKYPPVLIVTSDHDDRVFPAHSYKYGAAMQQAVRGRCDAGPVFMRIERDAGHGGSTPINKWIEEWSDEMGFALHFMP